MDLIDQIRNGFETGVVYYTNHAKSEMVNEEYGRIFDHEIFEAIINGEIIEEYFEDKPYPSVLVYGTTKNNRPLHIVCAYDELDELVIIITVYQPNPKMWIDYKERRYL